MLMCGRNRSFNNSGIVVILLCDPVLDFGASLFISPFFFFFCLPGSARRKLTCTICNRKCSSSLNLQEHRKVRLGDICHRWCNLDWVFTTGLLQTHSERQ